MDGFCLVLIVAAVGAFSWGVVSLGQGSDLRALYLLIVGALLLAAASRMLQPTHGASRSE